ncbi:MAG: phosphoglycerate kinase [Chloroflexota bacterium]|nr:phosphoglycerate kinase [Chloroflexota bacterium]
MLRTLDDLELAGKTAFVRVDFNVPLDKSGSIQDDTRMVAALPTLRKLRELGVGKLIAASHLGRPKGIDPAYSMRPVARHLSELLGLDVQLLPLDLDEARAAVLASPQGSVLMLENTRFYSGETSNAEDQARKLASLADVYVDDAFGSAHRAHASTEGIAHLLPSAAGLLLQREVAALSGLLESPSRPFVALLGGAKVSDKLGVIRSLLDRVDRLLIGGAMANTFFLGQGLEVGKSLVEPDQVELARELLRNGGEKLVLPVDCVVADSLESEPQIVPCDQVPPEKAIYDIGPATVELFRAHVSDAATVFWNGPMGVFEVGQFARGTVELAQAAAASSAHTVIGGGDSIAAVSAAGVAASIDHISTGGGASLELLEGKVLPGVAVLERPDA